MFYTINSLLMVADANSAPAHYIQLILLWLVLNDAYSNCR
jgi:hypothetical protein